MPKPERQYFKDGQSWWMFRDYIERSSRFVDWTLALEDIKHECLGRVSPVEVGTRLYRARLLPPPKVRPGSTHGSLAPLDMWPPSAERAVGNRLNPQGIPYLYLARAPQTAVAELRPWRTAELTVAEFAVTARIQLFDFVGVPEEPRAETFLLRKLSEMFAMPSHAESQFDYAATQFVSEYLKHVGKGAVAGIQYPSSLDEGGVNVALFGDASRPFEKLVSCGELQDWTVSRVKVESARVSRE